MEDPNSTYLEDFLQSLEALPNSFRRECELMKELDREVYELSHDIAQIEAIILLNIRRIKGRPPIKSEATISGEGKVDAAGASINDAVSFTLTSAEAEQLQLENEQLLRDRKLLCNVAQQKTHDKKAIARSIIEMVNQFEDKLGSDLAHFEQDLKLSGDYEAPPGIAPNSEVAVKLTIDAQDKTLILAQVRLYRSEINSYEIIDVDDQQKYTLPDSQVFEVGQAETVKKVSKGDHVYALYPDTTIFYPATVLSAPKRINLSSNNLLLISSQANSTSSATDNYSLPVQFHGDEDHEGNIPVRVVPLKYIVRAPQFL